MRIDLHHPSYPTPPGQQPTPNYRKKRICSVILFVVAVAFAVAAGLSWRSSATDSQPLDASYSSRLSLLRHLSEWISSLHAKTLAKEERLNLLILGQGGIGHEGPWLTDTILLLSVQPKAGDVVVISIPRDLAVPVPEMGLKKINSVNAIGETRDVGNGAALATYVIGKTLGLPIAAYLRIDFKGFTELVDIIGGVDIDVERSFTDRLFPDGNAGGIKTVHFAKGLQHMDGATALIFSRSRLGDNGEGSDFARARRQQKVALAIKDKLFRLDTILSPGKLGSVVRTLRQNITTNIYPRQYDDLLKIARATQGRPVVQFVLDSSPQGALTEGVGPDGSYLLLPRHGYDDLARFVQSLFVRAEVREENARIVVLNGTLETGLAHTAAEELKNAGFTVAALGNAPRRPWQGNTVFTLVSSSKPASLSFLKNHYHAREAGGEVPADILQAAVENMTEEDKSVDFILVLGK